MELVGRFPDSDDVSLYQVQEGLPTWLPAKGDDKLKNILSEEVVSQLRAIRKLKQMSIQSMNSKQNPFLYIFIATLN